MLKQLKTWWDAWQKRVDEERKVRQEAARKFWIQYQQDLLERKQEQQAQLSRDHHRKYGTHRVLYNDGFYSEPFLYETALAYAKMHGGRVVERDAYPNPAKKV